METGYIYLLINKINGKRYIGFTTDLEARKSNHINRANAGTHKNILISNAIKKYGWDAFDYIVIDSHPDAEYAKNVLEPKYIKEYDTYFENKKGYNMTYGGEGTLGYKRTEEEKRRMSEQRKGKKKNLTEEQRKKISENTSGENNPNYGKTHSKETRKKISEGIKLAYKEGRIKIKPKSKEHIEKLVQASKNRVYTPELRKKISDAKKGRPGHPHTEEHKKYMSEIMKGRKILKESIDKTRLGVAKYLWILKSPSGEIYETYSMLLFAKINNVNPKTFESKWRAKINNEKRRRGTCKWEVLDKIPITEEIRKIFSENPEQFYRIKDKENAKT